MPLIKHGMHKTPTYRRWAYMKRRCKADADYLRKGITVCREWEQFENFLRDMGEVPEGTTLDRIDGTRGYEPGNCRWATYAEQNRNLSRNLRAPDGRVAADIAKEHGLSHTAVGYRIKNGLPVDALRIGERDHCKRGHPWDDANTYYAQVKRKQGGTRMQRYCRKCRAEFQAERRNKSNYVLITRPEQLKQLNPKRVGE